MRRAAYYAGKACALDEMTCCWRLAQYYLNGNGVPEDLEKAVQLHSKVCDGPVGIMTKSSCGTVGDLLVNGAGKRNFFMGITYLSRACALGNEFGCRMHDRYAGTGRVSDHEPPNGAMGFTFGWSSNQAKTTCAELHGKWSPSKKLGGGKTTGCDLHVPALGHDVQAALGFVDDRLVWISADYEPEQGSVIGEHTRVGELLVESYGIPSGRKSIVQDACGGQASFALCLAKKQAEFEMWWDFKNHQYHILLSLTGFPKGRIVLSLLYSTPESERLIGNPGL
jgi:hypothetical protein